MAESVALKGMPFEKKISYMLYKTYEVLVEVGYNNITLDMVADKVGVSKGTISYHFSNKEKLMSETLEHISSVVFMEVERFASENNDPKQRLLGFVESMWRAYWENPEYQDIVKVYFDLWFHGMYNKNLYEAACSADRKFYDLTYGIVSDIYNVKKEERDEDVFAKVIMIGSAIDGAAKVVLSGAKKIDRDRLFQELKSTVLKIVD